MGRPGRSSLRSIWNIEESSLEDVDNGERRGRYGSKHKGKGKHRQLIKASWKRVCGTINNLNRK